MKTTSAYLSRALAAAFAAFALTARADETPAALSQAFLRYDASATNTLTFETAADGTTNVTKWANLGTGGEAYNANARTGKTGNTEWLPPQFVDGRVDFGLTKTPKDMTFREITNIWTVFWVVDIAQEDVFLLGDSTSFHFHRGMQGQYVYPHGSALAKDGQFWDNGEKVANPSGTLIPTGQRVISFLANESNGGLKADSLTSDRNGGDNRNGGRRLAELLIFTNRLEDAERREIEVWLQRKWTADGLWVSGPANGMDIACRPAPGWTFGLTNGQTVACTATNQAFFNGVHYTCAGCAVERWDTAAAPGAWDAPETNLNNGSYDYVHSGSAGRVTWLYEPDGYRLDTGLSPAGAGSVTVAPETNLPDGCYTNGTKVTLTAAANYGFTFLRWTENGKSLGTDERLTIAMDRPRSVTAEFDYAPFIWAGGVDGVWTNGGATGWINPDGTLTNWFDGAAAVFTNDEAASAAIAADGVSASAVRVLNAAGLTLTGGTLTMANAAEISAAKASDVILNVPVAGTDGLTLRGRQVRDLAFPGFLTKSDQLVFPGVKLAELDCNCIAAQMAGGWVAGGKVPVAAAAHHVTTNADGSLSIQYQYFDDGFVKCVKALFTDGPGGVQAKILWSRNRNNGTLGDDLDSGGHGPADVATSQGANGYGLCGLTASVPGADKVPGRFVIGRPAAFSGKLTLFRGRLEFGPEGRLGTNGTFDGEVVNHGIIVTPPGWQTFTGRAGGLGSFLAGGRPGSQTAYIREMLVTNQEYTVIETNGSLANLTGAAGFTCSTAFGNPCKNVPYTFTGFETNNSGIAVHLQIYDYASPNDHHTKCVRIQLSERPGGKIIAVHDKSYYYKNSYRIGDIPGVNGNNDSIGGSYEVQRLCLFFGGGSWVSFHNAAWTGGLTVSNGAVAAVETATGLPSAGRIEAAGGGEIRCYESTAGNNPAPGGTNPVFLRDGGVLDFAGPQVFSRYDGTRQIFIENGGFIRPYAGAGDNVNYLNHLDVLNGGTVLEGPPFRVGYNKQNAILKVRGNAPCRQMAGYRFCGQSTNNAETLTLEVEDVTSNAAPDLVISGNIVTDPSLHDLKTVKTGAGTAVYSGRNSHNGPTSIDQGTLRFETDSALGTNAPVILNGGAAGASCALDIGTNRNSIGTLALERNGGRLILGAGGTIAFADSSAVAWTNGATLTIQGELGSKTVRFGTNADGLTSDQLGQIKLTGAPDAKPFLDRTGWLCAKRATVIILR